MQGAVPLVVNRFDHTRAEASTGAMVSLRRGAFILATCMHLSVWDIFCAAFATIDHAAAQPRSAC
jgi:hypothetical protein